MRLNLISLSLSPFFYDDLYGLLAQLGWMVFGQDERPPPHTIISSSPSWKNNFQTFSATSGPFFCRIAPCGYFSTKMADPLSVPGVVNPIADDFLSLVRQMRKIYKKVRYARQNLKKMTDRTEIVAGTFKFFGDAMTRAMRVKKLTQTFKRHRDLVKKVENESQQIVDRLTDIKNIFRFLISGKPVNMTDECIAHYQWYRRSKKIIPRLFQDMEVLESSMRTIGILANTHILLHDYKVNGSKELWEQM
jgi:hypothetical protein